MWAVGYFIGVVVGAILVACSMAYDLLLGMIVFLVIAGVSVGFLVTAALVVWEKGYWVQIRLVKKGEASEGDLR